MGSFPKIFQTFSAIIQTVKLTTTVHALLQNSQNGYQSWKLFEQRNENTHYVQQFSVKSCGFLDCYTKWTQRILFQTFYSQQFAFRANTTEVTHCSK